VALLFVGVAEAPEQSLASLRRDQPLRLVLDLVDQQSGGHKCDDRVDTQRNVSSKITAMLASP
jgi:hypothetical protein